MCKYKTSSLKLSEKTNIRILEISHIRNPIPDHHETIETSSEGESTIDLRIEPSFAEDVWVNQSSAHEFDPAGSFADTTSLLITERTRKVDLNTRLDEGEVARTHTDIDLFPEYIREHGFDGEFQVSDTDPLIDDDALDLVECILMGRIDIFITKYASDDH